MFINNYEYQRLYWTIAILIATPLLTVLFLEIELLLKRRNSTYKSVFHWLRVLFLPLFGLWLALVQVAGFSYTEPIPKIVATLVDVAGIVVGLSFINAVLFANVTEDSWQARTPKLLVDIVRLFLVVIGVAIVLSLVWGVDLGQVAAALGIGSIVIGLAIAEPLGNVFAGLMLLVERPIAVGDWIKIGDQVGQVIEINWRAVHLRTFLRELVVVPNAILAKESFSNYSRPTKLHCENITLGFSYDDAPNKVRAILLDLLEQTPGVLNDPPPAVRVFNYGDFSIDYRVIFFVEEFTKLGMIRDAFMTKVWYAARREGITIPFPTATEIGVEAHELAAKAQPPIESTIDHLALFAPLSASQKEKTKPLAGWRSFARNEAIAEIGSTLEGLFVIVDGRVRASCIGLDSQPVVCFEAGPGEIFGESIANGGRISELKFTAIEDVNCLLLKPDLLRELLIESNRFARDISGIAELRAGQLRLAIHKPRG